MKRFISRFVRRVPIVVLAATLAAPAPAVTALAVPAITTATASAEAPGGGTRPSDGLRVSGLRVDGMSDPLGTEVTTPALSWRVRSDRNGTTQTAYELEVASTSGGLDRGGADLWNSGRTTSPEQTLTYAGAALGSRDRAWWRVRVWDERGRVSAWSQTAHWELGLLEPTDWTADWIRHPAFGEKELHPVTVGLTRATARYVRLEASLLGLPLQEGFGRDAWRLQLAEVQVLDSGDSGTDLAAGRSVTANRPYVVAGVWEPRLVTDGVLSSDEAQRGYTSLHTFDPDVSADPMWVQIDLGEARTFDRLVLYPRTDALTPDGRTPGFPRDYRVLAGGATPAEQQPVATVTDQPTPAVDEPDPRQMPVFARQFDLPAPVRSARLYTTGLGVFAAEINGQSLGDSVLDPANTDYEKRVTYSTFDVTDRLREGRNVLGMRLGNGIYNVPDTPGRYAKFVGSDGPPQLIAQLEVELTDGSRVVIESDGQWHTTLGATTFSSWYGGEDHDARLVPAGWGEPDADLVSWDYADVTTPPSSTTRLSARHGPGIEVVDRIVAQRVTNPAPGVHVFDVGTNVAGWPELKVRLPAGSSVEMWPDEQLVDGRVSQASTGKPTWDTYTTAGHGTETWHPEFSYHGFRYVEVRGLPDGPLPLDTVTALVLRAANEQAGSFSSSNALVNGIHRIIDRAVQSNMYSVLTDCPHREKLGWLEETHLVWETVARGYDVSAYGRDLTRNMADAQTPEGLVPDIAPEYTVFGGGFRDDPNWGSAIIQVPWRMYRSYGDIGGLRPFYDEMTRYLDYLSGKADDNLLSYGLGDWITFDNSTPVGVTATFGYHEAAQSLANIAAVLGEDADAARYQQLAADIRAAFHAKYFDDDRGTYASGSQASDALALDMGAVPDDLRERVLDHLLASIEAEHYHFTVGEIALPSIIRVLHESGHDDVMYRVADQTTNPSYGYQVVHGATSLTERWDGPTSPEGQSSLNHFMLGAIDEWFSGALAGIGQQEGSIGYRALTIEPSVVGDLTHVEGSYRSPYGEVVSRWEKKGRQLTMRVEVPVGSTARVLVPTYGEGRAWRPTADRGARYVGTEGDAAVFEVGSGSWRFRSRLAQRTPAPEPQVAVDAPGDVLLLAGEPRTVDLTLTNLEERAVTVRPTATAPEGWSASLTPSSVSIPAGEQRTVTLRLAVDAADGSAGKVTVDAGSREVTIDVGVTDNPVRVARMSASSTYGQFVAAKAADGDVAPTTDIGAWNAGGGWNDDTSAAYPDLLTATWATAVELTDITVYTLDAPGFPASRFGIRDADVEVLVNGAWTAVAQLRGNTAGVVERSFAPVRTTGLRLVVTATNSGDFSRVVELEAGSG